MSKKRRKNGSLNSGLVFTRTRVELWILTTAGVTLSSTGASDGNGSPSIDAGSAAWARCTASSSIAADSRWITVDDEESTGNGVRLGGGFMAFLACAKVERRCLDGPGQRKFQETF